MNQYLRLAYGINQMAECLNKEADAVLEHHFGVSYKQFLIFVGLIYMQPCSQKQLAEFIHLTSAGTLHLLRKLEREKWITKHYNQSNRRTAVIEMTEKGHKIFAMMNTKLGDRLNELLHISAQDVTIMETIHAELLDNLKTAKETVDKMQTQREGTVSSTKLNKDNYQHVNAV